MQPRPSRLITPKSKNSLKPQGTRPIFLTGDEPHGSKPSFQRDPRSLKHGARRNRYFRAAIPTIQVSTGSRPRLGMLSTLRTLKSLRPPTCVKVAAAGCVISKPVHKLLIVTRVVDSGLGSDTVVHAVGNYILWSLASSGYPVYNNIFLRYPNTYLTRLSIEPS